MRSVVETKGSLFMDALRQQKGAKIECGKAHFNALGTGPSPPKYVVARSVQDFLGQVQAPARKKKCGITGG
jgi:type III restriction enzyme